MSGARERVEDALIELTKEDPAEALAIATGIFVSLLTSYMTSIGLDTNKQIHVDGGDNRDITVHAPKAAEIGKSMK